MRFTKSQKFSEPSHGPADNLLERLTAEDQIVNVRPLTLVGNFAVLPWPAMAPLALRTAFQLSKRSSSRCCPRGWSSLALWLLWGGTVLSAVLCCIFVICQVFGKFSTLCTKFIIIFPLCNSTFKGLSTDLHARQMRIAIVHQGLNHVRWPKPGSSTGLTILCLHIFQMLHVWNTYLGTCGWFWG